MDRAWLRGWLGAIGLCVVGGAALAHPIRPALVPPTKEVQVLDPNVDPVGDPAIIPAVGPDGVTRITIPPTVLVHRYYYSGDRTFQAQFLPGGPCLVVVNHPRSGERLYVPVQFPPGAPRITYTGHVIEYDYRSTIITLKFCTLTGAPKVVYRDGCTTVRNMQDRARAFREGCAALVQRTGLPDLRDSVVEKSRGGLESAADRTRDVGSFVLRPIQQAVRMIPGVNMLTSTPEERAERDRDNMLRRATEKANRDATIFVPTNR